MKYLRRFNESKDPMCRLISEEEYNNYWEIADENKKPISVDISPKVKNLYITQLEIIEKFYGNTFNRKNLSIDSYAGKWGYFYSLEYFSREKHKTLFIRLTAIEDDYYLIDFNDHSIDSFHFVCDQDWGLKEFATTVIPLIKNEYEKFNLKLPKINESNTDPLVVPITLEEFEDWVENRYVGLPNEKAKWAMIDSIRLFEESLVHQSSKLSGKYEDKYMSKTYIHQSYKQQYGKMAWEYYRRVGIGISDFKFTMFEGDDYWFIIRLFVNYHCYYYKVDDIVGIENFFDAIKKTREDFFW